MEQLDDCGPSLRRLSRPGKGDGKPQMPSRLEKFKCLRGVASGGEDEERMGTGYSFTQSL